MSAEPKPKKKKKKLPNARQQALLKNLAKGMTQTDAAIAAGYTPKHPGKSAHQALAQIAKTWPERLEAVVGSPEKVIEKYLIPLMNATETKATMSQKDNQFRYSKPMKAWAARANGLDIYARIAGAYAPKDPAEAAPFGVKVIVIDIPRPRKDIDWMPDIGPGQLPPANGSNGSNGHKE